MIYDISTDTARLNIELICQELQSTYWAQERTSEQIVKSIRNAICFGAYEGMNQVGFARVISDQSTFAYLCDIFVVEHVQHQGVAQQMINAIIHHENLRGVSWVLRTRDAHGLYEKFGFRTTTRPERYMERKPL